MNALLPMIYYTFLDTKRNKVIYALLGFVVAIIALEMMVSEASLGGKIKVASDMGLASIEIFSTILAIFLAVFSVYREISLKTLHPILAKPIARHTFILGKFFGLLLTVVYMQIIMTAIFSLTLLFYGNISLIFTYLPVLYMIFLQTMLIVAVAVFCSTLIEPIVAALISIGFFILGAISNNLMMHLSRKGSDLFKSFVSFLSYVLPDFHYFNIKDNVVYASDISNINFFTATLYAIFYSAVILAISVIFFNKKEIQ